MATVYVLPPRRLLADQLAQLVQGIMPGMEPQRDQLFDWFSSVAAPDAVVVHREDLPDGIPTLDALKTYFGVDDGDHVVQISHGPSLLQPKIQMLQSV
jgi:hypothetical protein